MIDVNKRPRSEHDQVGIADGIERRLVCLDLSLTAQLHALQAPYANDRQPPGPRVSRPSRVRATSVTRSSVEGYTCPRALSKPLADLNGLRELDPVASSSAESMRLPSVWLSANGNRYLNARVSGSSGSAAIAAYALADIARRSDARLVRAGCPSTRHRRPWRPRRRFPCPWKGACEWKRAHLCRRR